MNKKIFGFLLAALMIFLLAGCGSGRPAADNDQPADEGTRITETAGAAASNEDIAEENTSEEQLPPDTANQEPAAENILVVYFSYTGHLDSMAHWIADETGGDLVRVTAKESYPDDYNETVDRAKKEQTDNARPEISVDLTETRLADYDTVFFGFPVWWYDLPMPMWTFLEEYSLSGKTIIPFFSHAGSSNGANSLNTLEALSAEAVIRKDDALSIHGDKVADSEQDVRSWVNRLGFGKTAGQTQVQEEAASLQIKIGDTAVNVDWEDNEAVQTLKDLCSNGPLSIQMSMYGGFEQVGPIGTSLPRNDEQTTTGAGDIVLYSGNQIVVFYGSNSWSYTRLGHITDQDVTGMTELLGNGDVTITISMVSIPESDLPGSPA